MQRRIKRATLMLILVALALPRIGLAQGSGPEVTLTITSIKRSESGFLVTGMISASGLNPEGQIVESDDVSIVVDVKTGVNAKYPLLPRSMYVQQPEGAETPYTEGSGPGGTMTRSEHDGVDIKSIVIAQYPLRNSPVWSAYGGLGEWEKNAPSSVTRDFEGVIPLEYEGKTLRIRATLAHRWGGPNAAWPAFSFHHSIAYEGVLKAMEDRLTSVPSPEPDAEDLCPETPGTTELCGCSNIAVMPGDVIFRYAKPAWGSWYAGYAEVEGKKYNFGHVAVYAGNFQAKRTYQVRHAKGVDVQRLNPHTQAWETIHLSKGDTIQANDIVNNAVIEADMGYGGVGISNLSNFESDHDGTAGSTPGGTMYGQPPIGLSCRQRKLIIDRMAQFAADTDEGRFEYHILSTNCAQTVAQAYTEAGLNAWGSPTETWTPNFVASWMLLSHFGEPRPGLNSSALSEPKVSIVVKSPADLQVYDSTGRHTGVTSNGIESRIPYSEYWQLENGHKVLNLLAQADDTYNIVVNGYAEGPIELEITAYNFFATEQTHHIHYQPVIFTSQTSAQIFLDPSLSPEASKLTLAIDRDGDGQIDQYETPTITIAEIDAGGRKVGGLPSLNLSADTLYLIGSLIGGGICLLLLLLGGIVLLARRGKHAERGKTIRDAQGYFWYQDPRTGVWLFWNGQAWQAAQRQSVSPSPGLPPVPDQSSSRKNSSCGSCLLVLLVLVVLSVIVFSGVFLLQKGIIGSIRLPQMGTLNAQNLLKTNGGGLFLEVLDY